jgi:proteic killer suppression protein
LVGGCALVIVSFGDEATEALFHGERGKVIRRLPPEIRSAAIRTLDMLNAARELRDLLAPPGNRLEALQGDLKGRHSIRVNEQWGLVFRWDSGDAHEVEIVDYH